MALGRALAPFGLKATKYIAEQMVKRGITAEKIVDVVRSGSVFRDIKTGATVYWEDGIAVIRQGLKLVTTHPITNPAKMKKWQPIPK